jgi:hypothetical protein
MEHVMRRYFVIAFLFFALPAHALESLRVGNQVLTVGDSAARVRALLGKPTGHGKSSGSSKAASKNSASRKGKQAKSASATKGETWQYWRDGHATTITIVDGKVSHIEDRAR